MGGGWVVVGHGGFVWVGVDDCSYALVVYSVQHALGLFVDVGVAVR